MANSMNVAKGVITGLVLGGTVGAIVTSSIQPKKSKLKKRTAHALDTVGSIMQNIADYTR